VDEVGTIGPTSETPTFGSKRAVFKLLLAAALAACLSK